MSKDEKETVPVMLEESKLASMIIRVQCSKCGTADIRVKCNKCGCESEVAPPPFGLPLLFTDKQMQILEQLVGIFGKSIFEVMTHIITENLPEYIDRCHKAYANFKANLDIQAQVQAVIERVKKQQNIMKGMII